MRAVEIDPDRLLARIDTFAAIGATARGGVNRQALSDEDRLARGELARLARARGFLVHQDPIANLFIRRAGRDDSRPPLVIGSHLDSQPAGGRFDGALGTLAAFEALESLEDARIETDMPIEVVAWTNEEGSRFAPGAMGSMAFAEGAIDPGWLEQHDRDGLRLADALRETLEALPDARMLPLGRPLAGYFELHIEQAPSLEKDGIPLGVVEGIQGTRWYTIAFEGQAGHAGTTALAYRRDPMQAAARAMDALYAAIMPGDPLARCTVGRVSVAPGAINSIPERVVFTLDLRHPEAAMLDRLEARIDATCRAAASACGCSHVIERIFDMAPAVFPKAMTGCVVRAAERLELVHMPMISGAFHDALHVGRVAPAAMIFVPCRDGLSHNEAEYAAPGDCANGARALLATVEAWLGRD